MITKRLKAKRECAIKTKADRHYFGAGDVADVKFANKAEFESHMQSGFYEETGEPIGYADIPIIEPPVIFNAPVIPTTEEPIGIPGVFDTTPVVPDLDMDKPEDVVSGPSVIDLDMTKEPEVVTLTDEEILKRENAKGKPFKCVSVGCGRQRKKTSLYCDVCLENMKS